MRPQVPDDYLVDFDYYTAISKRPPKGETSCVETIVTRATVYSEDPQNTRSFRGIATLSPNDEKFSLRIGRDVALGRAISQLRERAAA